MAGIAAVHAYLGIASITLPDQPGSWGTLGGTIALVASAAYLVTGVPNRPTTPVAVGVVGQPRKQGRRIQMCISSGALVSGVYRNSNVRPAMSRFVPVTVMPSVGEM